MPYRIRRDGTIEADSAQEALQMAKLLQEVGPLAELPTPEESELEVSLVLPDRSLETVLETIQKSKGTNPFSAKEIAACMGIGSGREIGVLLGKLHTMGFVTPVGKIVRGTVETTDAVDPDSHSTRMWKLLGPVGPEEWAARKANGNNGKTRRPSAAVQAGVRIGQRWVKKSGFHRRIRVEELGFDHITPAVLEGMGTRWQRKPMTYSHLTRVYRLEESDSAAS